MKFKDYSPGCYLFYKICFCISLLLLQSVQSAYSQRTLNLVKSSFDEVEDLLGSAKNKINKLTVQSESSLNMDINCEYTGFTDKKYSLKIEALNKTKQPLKEVAPVTVELNSRANSIDFSLQFKPLPNQVYQTNIIESSFIKLTIDEEGSQLDKLLGSGMSNRPFLFECKKEWTIKSIANNNTVVEIKLVPLSSVSKMKPSN